MHLEVLPDIKFLRVKEATDIELAQLEISLTKQIDGWAFKKKYYAGWDGKVTFIKNGLIPLGLWKDVYDICKKFDYKLQIDGLNKFINSELSLNEFTEWVNTEFEGNNIQPRDYQIETAWKIIKYKSCLGELATSAGKTLITFMVFAYMLKKLQMEKILMIVPNVTLVEQADGDFYEYNSPKIIDYEIQLIYSGKKIKQSSNIVVGTYQSLVKKPASFFQQFDAVCVDEVHKAKSTSIKTILQKCRHTQYTFGVSGTIPKPGTLDRMTIMSQTGPVVQEVGTKFLIDKGHITPVEIKILKMNYAPKEIREAFFKASRSTDSQRMYKLERDYIIENKERLDFVTDVISRTNKNSLVLFHRTSYGKSLFNMLRNKNKGRTIYYVDGSTSVDIREEYKRRMENNVNEVEYCIFKFNDYQVAIPENDMVLLTNGEYIEAKSISINDEIDDNFLKKYKKEPLPK